MGDRLSGREIPDFLPANQAQGLRCNYACRSLSDAAPLLCPVGHDLCYPGESCSPHWGFMESFPARLPQKTQEIGVRMALGTTGVVSSRPCAWRSSASPRARLLRLDVNDLGSILRKLRFRIRPGCPGSSHAGTLGNRRLRCGGSSSDCEMFPEHKGPLPPVQLHFFLQGFGHSGRPTGLVSLAPRCCIRALEPTSVLRPHRESFRGSRSFRAGTRSHSCRHTQWAESHHRLSI